MSTSVLPKVRKIAARAACRRQFVPAFIRQELLFRLTGWVLRLFPYPQGITLGKNVRIQRLRCFRVEQPDAEISLGAHSIVYEHARVEAYGAGKIEIGESCILGDTRITSRARIVLGARVITSWNVFLQDFDPHPICPDDRRKQVLQMTGVEKSSEGPQSFSSTPIVIGDDVWIGANVTILKGATIGAGSVVAAGAVVPGKAFPARSIIAGNPARVVKEIL